MVCIFVYIFNTQSCKHFVWRKQSKTKLYFTVRMLLSNFWKISSVCSKIFNKGSIRRLFNNKTGFYFLFGEQKTKEQMKAKPHNRAARLLCQPQRRKWLPAGISVIPGYNTKKKTQPYELHIRAVKAICAFTASPNPFEAWLSNRHCTNPLSHRGQQRCRPLLLIPPSFPHLPGSGTTNKQRKGGSAVCWEWG